MTSFIRLIGITFVLVFSLPLVAICAEPDKNKTDTNKSDKQALDGLGFSVAPKEGGKTQTEMFGLVAEGYKFVYVFDRSGSMGGDGNASLKAVKKELLASLKNLDTVHQFQIIFYNERPVLFNPSGTPGKLAFANDRNKQAAERFLNTIQSNGGTDHEAALRLAAGLRPDVIFFLTDGDEPQFTRQQKEKIENWLSGIHINIIEFGSDPAPQKESFLKELARRLGGKYTYVDTTKFNLSKTKPDSTNTKQP